MKILWRCTDQLFITPTTLKAPYVDAADEWGKNAVANWATQQTYQLVPSIEKLLDRSVFSEFSVKKFSIVFWCFWAPNMFFKFFPRSCRLSLRWRIIEKNKKGSFFPWTLTLKSIQECPDVANRWHKRVVRAPIRRHLTLIYTSFFEN